MIPILAHGMEVPLATITNRSGTKEVEVNKKTSY